MFFMYLQLGHVHGQVLAPGIRPVPPKPKNPDQDYWDIRFVHSLPTHQTFPSINRVYNITFATLAIHDLVDFPTQHVLRARASCL